jgi:SAM-dependent methyltransferase
LPELPAGSSVLELGCGNGKTLTAMIGRPWSIVALDISGEAVRLSRLSTSEKVDFLIADAHLLPIRDRAFDAVFAFHVMGHILQPERQKMASEASRVLKDAGWLFFRDFGVDDMRAGQGLEVEPDTFRRGEGIITHYFAQEETVNLFSQLKPFSVGAIRWKIRIKGKDLIRSEVEAVFQKVVI